MFGGWRHRYECLVRLAPLTHTRKRGTRADVQHPTNIHVYYATSCLVHTRHSSCTRRANFKRGRALVFCLAQMAGRRVLCRCQLLGVTQSNGRSRLKRVDALADSAGDLCWREVAPIVVDELACTCHTFHSQLLTPTPLHQDRTMEAAAETHASPLAHHAR